MDYYHKYKVEVQMKEKILVRMGSMYCIIVMRSHWVK